MQTVEYETPDGIKIVHPDDTHTDQNPLLTMVYSEGDTVTRVIQVPLERVVRIEKPRNTECVSTH